MSSSRRTVGVTSEKKSQQQKNINYKSLLDQYYDRDHEMKDIRQQLRSITPQIDILDLLMQFDQQIDALIKIKRYDVQEMFMKPIQKCKRILRIYLSKEKIQNDNIIKLWGNLKPFQKNMKFTTFFKQIKFKSKNNFDKIGLQTWKRPKGTFQQRDGLLIHIPQTVIHQGLEINLHLIHNPPKFQIDIILQKIINIKIGTRVEVLEAFWGYIKNKKLQDLENKQIINADENLRNIFKSQKLAFATINNRIRELLIPIQPILLELESNENYKVWDLLVEMQQRPNIDVVPFFATKLNEQKTDHPFLELNRKIKKYNKKFIQHTQKLRRHLAKRQIYRNFKVETIENIIRQQHELLKQLSSIDCNEEYNKLQYLLDNEQEIEKQIKHYYEQISLGSNNNTNNTNNIQNSTLNIIKQ